MGVGEAAVVVAVDAASAEGCTEAPATEVSFFVVIVDVVEPAGFTSDGATVVVTLLAGSPVRATDVGSEFRSMDSYFACVGGGGFGCEQETTQSNRRKDTIVFIF